MLCSCMLWFWPCVLRARTASYRIQNIAAHVLHRLICGSVPYRYMYTTPLPGIRIRFMHHGAAYGICRVDCVLRMYVSSRFRLCAPFNVPAGRVYKQFTPSKYRRAASVVHSNRSPFQLNLMCVTVVTNKTRRQPALMWVCVCLCAYFSTNSFLFYYIFWFSFHIIWVNIIFVIYVIVGVESRWTTGLYSTKIEYEFILLYKWKYSRIWNDRRRFYFVCLCVSESVHATCAPSSSRMQSYAYRTNGHEQN